MLWANNKAKLNNIIKLQERNIIAKFTLNTHKIEILLNLQTLYSLEIKDFYFMLLCFIQLLRFINYYSLIYRSNKNNPFWLVCMLKEIVRYRYFMDNENISVSL